MEKLAFVSLNLPQECHEPAKIFFGGFSKSAAIQQSYWPQSHTPIKQNTVLKCARLMGANRPAIVRQ